MLDIPELDELICQQLSRHDLVQCTRVYKKWHRIVVPEIWRDLSSENFSEPQQAAFVQLVRNCSKRATRNSYLMDTTYHQSSFSWNTFTNSAQLPVTFEALDGRMAELIREYVLPQLVAFTNVDGSVNEKGEAYGQEGSGTWQFKRLALMECQGWGANVAFWPWLWKRCGQVEHLELEFITKDIRKQLIERGITYMFNLNKISITDLTLDMNHTEELLSSSRRGWKEVRLHRHFSSSPITAHLIKHRFTLQRLVLDGNCGVTDSDKVQLLACCPHLYDFTNIHTWNNQNGVAFEFNAHSFIDLDPDTG
ncbi:MAG: hypothetical protein J3Q66DRAFT_404338 [Benniella sp.]|nr:MAG: hypothetical protein J3Q66DRAFT_404338 [Benniella sp.]